MSWHDTCVPSWGHCCWTGHWMELPVTCLPQRYVSGGEGAQKEGQELLRGQVDPDQLPFHP